MPSSTDDLRDCPTAYECRDRLPELAAWLSDDELRQVRIWKGARFDQGRMYFDLDNPDRGAFVATGNEGFPTDHTYVCRDDIMEDLWLRLVTWKQPVTSDQGRAMDIAGRRTSPEEAPLTGSVDEPPSR